jgi:hypothetical protein
VTSSTLEISVSSADAPYSVVGFPEKKNSTPAAGAFSISRDSTYTTFLAAPAGERSSPPLRIQSSHQSILFFPEQS